jgi:hypothetical protein
LGLCFQLTFLLFVWSLPSQAFYSNDDGWHLSLLWHQRWQKNWKKLSAVNERAQPSKKEMMPKGHRADYFHPK